MDKKRLHLLLVEDDEDDYILARDLLDEIEYEDFTLEWAPSYEAAVEKIGQGSYDLALVDYYLGAGTGLDLMLEPEFMEAGVPSILLTGQGDHQLDVKAMKAGAYDYLVKNRLDATSLERSIRYAVERRRAQIALEEATAQLHQSQKMEAFGQLAGGMAHDFNNLLSVIIGCAQLALEDIDADHPLYEMLGEINKAGERAATLTRQLLSFSRKEILQPKVLDLNELVLQMQKMLMRLIGEDVELDVRTNEGVGPVKADPGQIEQVVLNLVVNARDAMPLGGRLHISTGPFDLQEGPGPPGARPGPYAHIRVSDTGNGMDQATLKRVFEPFFTTKPVGTGTGLGLATVRRIMDQSDGWISVESQVNVGTTFNLYLPIAREELSTAAQVRTEDTALGDETVLVVEDDPAVRQLIELMLGSYGYRVLAVRSIREAIELGQSDQPLDLLLTDVVMPIMNGGELARQLRELRPGLKVLFMSGYPDDTLVLHGVSSGTAAFIAKPLGRDELLRSVRAVLDAGTGDPTPHQRRKIRLRPSGSK